MRGSNSPSSHHHRSIHLQSLAMRWIVVIAALLVPLAAAAEGIEGASAVAKRSLLGITEKQGNVSYICSPSGPCLRCQYSEKNDEKYRCSETGYRIPLKCEEIQNSSTGDGNNLGRRLLSLHGKEKVSFDAYRERLGRSLSMARYFRWRRLLDASSTPDLGKQSYITYRSCLPAETEERLSVFGFEVIMVCLLLVSAPVAYFRQRRPTIAYSSIGMARIQSGSSSRL